MPKHHLFLTLLCIIVAPFLHAESETKSRIGEAPQIQIAILLDTSSSMSGLINQARERIWTIVNDLAKTHRNDRKPQLQVALYQYGNSGLSVEDGYIQEITPFTDDLDAVSQHLFSLTTNGGDEYCGMVIQRAVEQQSWTSGDHFRVIFIAGNEPFTQGTLDYRTACAAAVERDIVVNTIHCGDESSGRSGMWQHGAQLGKGVSINIDHNQVQEYIPAPQDERLNELNDQLNKTYIPYGAQGAALQARQIAQDTNAASSSLNAFNDRAASKASGLYNNRQWDLVDAMRDGTVELDEISAENLPENMKTMSAEERQAHVAKKTAERTAIQEEIGKLAAERQAFISAEQEKRAKEANASVDDLGSAMQNALKGQLEEAGFSAE